MAHSLSNVFLQEMEHILLRQQEPISILRLAMYAADTMRVMTAFRQQADVSPRLEESLRSICPDWRNPGAVDDPADLIVQALFYSMNSLQKTLSALDQITKAMAQATTAS